MSSWRTESRATHRRREKGNCWTVKVKNERDQQEVHIGQK